MKGGGIHLIVFASKFAWVCTLCIGVGGLLYLFVSSVLVAWRHGYQAVCEGASQFCGWQLSTFGVLQFAGTLGDALVVQRRKPCFDVFGTS